MSMGSIQDIIIIGAGNVGCHLARALYEAGYTISQVAGRREERLIALAADVNAEYTVAFEDILPGKDLYIMALPDEVMEMVLPKLPLSDELLVHTSGSVPMDILCKYVENAGVFYPLQTFTKSKHIELNEVPFLIEANRIDNENKLIEVAQKLSNKVIVADSLKRLNLHIAAVFASNFSNHMYDIARRLLDEHGLDFELLVPLIMETASKATALGPSKAQTGPARRNDLEVIRKHLDLLKGNEEVMELYKRISESISDQEK